ncbi:hypothetical protein ACFFMN_05990 [Planobispora siamensis]|uniref:Uncharacterized protein n=1 Tax=Planobispora siamensis TaxID=936338 RepID=A0A8J3WLV2_9ACTN|nr:hypothetical protein [Planobispora siamensis]GIH94263.1 hypothetical protein Psi01_48930 [Planobispora siamensis]
MTTGYADEPSPEPLYEWRRRGFTVADARQWIEDGFSIDDAERWRGSGVYTAADVRPWRTAGATPYTVDLWLRAGMTPRDAVRWRELGYSPQEAADRHLAGERPHPRGRLWRLLHRSEKPGEAFADEERSGGMRRLLRAGVPAGRARAYVEAGWTGAAAVEWAKRGIEAGQARVFDALGLSAREAGRVLASGQDAISLMTGFWRAGVPLDEVAAWRAAGFTAEEAARMRAGGTDVEHAQVLRALTEGDDS